MEANENYELCKRCGGKCCKKSGCDYIASDFENLTMQYILDKLLNENISIVSFQNFKEINGHMTNTPYLYLRARNEGMGMVDLLSFKRQCTNLTDTGCKLSSDDRPSGGKNLVPGHPCYPLINPMELVKSWEPYQNVLRKLVKRLTGKSVDAQIRIDAYELFKKIFKRDFRGVSPIEVEDVLGMLIPLSECYKEEYERAKKDSICNVLSYKK